MTTEIASKMPDYINVITILAKNIYIFLGGGGVTYLKMYSREYICGRLNDRLPAVSLFLQI